MAVEIRTLKDKDIQVFPRTVSTAVSVGSGNNLEIELQKKQYKTDDTLNTENKTLVDAINELNTKILDTIIDSDLFFDEIDGILNGN